MTENIFFATVEGMLPPTTEKFSPSRRQFETWIAGAVAALPEGIRREMDNVAIILDDESPPGGLLGLYHGVPKIERTLHDSGRLPDKITIYQQTIIGNAATVDELPALVRQVVWHEIGHHFGFSERRIRKLERQWQQRDAKNQPAA